MKVCLYIIALDKGIYDSAFEGLIRNVERRYESAESTKAEYESYMRITPCSTCHGQRLKKESLAVTIGDKNIIDMTEMSVRDLRKF